MGKLRGRDVQTSLVGEARQRAYMCSRIGLLASTLGVAFACSSPADCKGSSCAGDGSGNERVADAQVVYLVEEGEQIHVREIWVAPENVPQVILLLEGRDDVSSASLSVPAQVFLEEAPNDPKFAEQWGLEATQFYNPDGQDAWSLSLGEGVQVAVLDDGIFGNKDLNPAGGWDVMFTDQDRTEGLVPETTREQYRSHGGTHGTHVSGVITAQMNNRKAIAGAAPAASLLSIRTRDRPGSIDILRGIEQAARPDQFDLPYRVQVLNISLGMESVPYSSAVFAEISEIAVQNGLLVVVAVGNEAELSNPVTIPASVPNFLGVGSVNNAPGYPVSEFSERGFFVDLVAPGRGIVTTTRPGFFSSYKTVTASGTSLAAPHVAAAAALLFSHRGMNCREHELVWDRRRCAVEAARLIQATARPSPLEAWTEEKGAGLLQTLSALTISGDVQLPTPPQDLAVEWSVREASEEVIFRLSWSAPAEGEVNTYAVYRDGQRIAETEATHYQDTFPTDPSPGDLLYQVTAVNSEKGESYSPPLVHCAGPRYGEPVAYTCVQKNYTSTFFRPSG